jgi:hypothetical protein
MKVENNLFAEIIVVGLILVIVIFLTLSSFEESIYKPPLTDKEKWELFKKEHNCKAVEKKDGHSTGGVGLTMKGQVGVIFGDDVPSQVRYVCDDGISYWKNEVF